MKRRHLSTFVLRLPLFALGFLSYQSLRADWNLQMLPERWHLAGFENSSDLSGIAAASPTQALVGSDEMFHIQPAVIDPAARRIESRPLLALPVEAEEKKAEIDIEGVAFCGKENAYFVIGSHGVGKKKGDFQPDRYSIFKVPVDPGTLRVLKEEIRKSSLLPWLEKTPLLAEHVKRPLQQNGLNIEGLTESGGHLFIGLRAPSKNGHALIVEADPEEIFGGEAKPLTVHEIAMEEGRGIRELVAVRGGFVLVTGNASAEASKKIPVTLAPGPDTRFDLLFWDGSNPELKKIGTLPENGGKAEALLVLAETDRHIDLLVVFDGLVGGEPQAVRIHR